MKTKKPIAILGAGMAGLTAANYLRKENTPFVLFEAGNKIAGVGVKLQRPRRVYLISVPISSRIDLQMR
jgi:cation diffusion facilitator CzcD-associated flavoprotein CzcO